MLYLLDICMGNNGFIHICEAFKYLPQLKKIDVYLNGITPEGVSYFVENIQYISKLEMLDVSCILKRL